MVDHEEMRKAYSRAMDAKYTEYVYKEYCNECKNPYDAESGYETTIYDGIASYTIWYCKECEAHHK